jgi:hypothetical protein
VIRVLAVTLLVLLAGAAGAEARKPTVKKGIWGPAVVDGKSQFPIYRELGAGLYHLRLRWNETALARPANPRDPADPAYAWSPELDDAVARARAAGMKIAVEVAGTPGWANGGKEPNWVPKRLGDYADFVAAAVRRYRAVRYWVIWGEPTRPNFMPLPVTKAGRKLTRKQKAAPHRYARLLDKAYAAVKSVNRHARVVGGNSFSSGDIGPRNWIRNLKLPSGRPPRMDLYGHNPFSARKPDLSDDLIRPGMADFGDLDALARWIDRDLGRRRGGKRIKIFIGEYAIPTDQPNYVFGWWVRRKTQANWLRAALRITRRWHRIETLVYYTLYDQAPRPQNDEFRSGLIDHSDRRKPAFYAYRRG